MTSPDDVELFDTSTKEVGDDEEVHPVKRDFEAKQSTAQLPKKSAGRARLIVEYFFEFSPEYLKEHGCRDGVDLARKIAEELEESVITIDDVEALVRKHGDLPWRIEAAK